MARIQTEKSLDLVFKLNLDMKWDYVEYNLSFHWHLT